MSEKVSIDEERNQELLKTVETAESVNLKSCSLINRELSAPLKLKKETIEKIKQLIKVDLNETYIFADNQFIYWKKLL